MSTVRTEIAAYRGAITIDRMINRRHRRAITRAVFFAILAVGLAACVHAAVVLIESGSFNYALITDTVDRYVGVALVLFAAYMAALQLSFFYNSQYYRDVSTIAREEKDSPLSGLGFEAASICARAKDDLTAAFLTSRFGREVLLRAGAHDDAIATFLASSRPRIDRDSIRIPDGRFFTAHDLCRHLMEHDKELRDFLFHLGIRTEHVTGASEWIFRVRNAEKHRERWWGRDNLNKVPGLGREFALGVAFHLEQFTRSLSAASSFHLPGSLSTYADEVVGKVETVLSRNRASNVLLVGAAGVGSVDMLIELERRIDAGESSEALSGKRLVLFDKDSFVAAHDDETLEAAFLQLLREAEYAGNIILVIEHLPTLLADLASHDVNAADLLAPFLASPNLQIAATADPMAFHDTVEPVSLLMQHFDAITVEASDLSGTVRLLEDAVPQYEHSSGALFTYPAVLHVAEAADRYIVDGVLPDKALELLAEIAVRAEQEKRPVVDPDFVDACVTAKTGVATGPVTEDERAKLLRLEEILHKRVIGQDAAVSAIADAMRRSRAGIQDASRPIGSFLFLGSTGVGKTETAKALAEAFFGSEENMLRFDMSEFSGGDAFAKFAGDKHSSGLLENALRSTPYSVLLLDEFEKASTEIHDLFLQILDEGMYTDAMGRRVNARNTIVIATSNAGSGRIFTAAQAGKDPSEAKEEIVNAIIADNVFRPELVNRFDGVIIFETLSPEYQTEIAKLMLADLVERTRQKGYELSFDDSLVAFLVAEGYDPKFGARPMRRVIQDVIEERLATRIIEGSLKAGDAICLTAADVRTA